MVEWTKRDVVNRLTEGQLAGLTDLYGRTKGGTDGWMTYGQRYMLTFLVLHGTREAKYQPSKDNIVLNRVELIV